MELISEIAKSLGLNEYAPSPYGFSVVGNAGGYVQNVKKLIDIKRSQIIVGCGNHTIVFYGEDLSVRSFSGGDLSLKGKINKIEVKNVDR